MCSLSRLSFLLRLYVDVRRRFNAMQLIITQRRRYYTWMCDVLDVHVASLPVTWLAREKKRVKCEGPPSLGVVYQNAGVWRVIARLT